MQNRFVAETLAARWVETGDACVCLRLSVWTGAQSGQRRATSICRCSVSNAAGQVCWQRGWMRRVWRASSQRWSHHLKPALHLSTELVCIFLPPSLVCRVLTFSLVRRRLFCFVSPVPFLCLYHILIFFLSPSIFPLLPVSIYFIYRESPFLFLPASVFVSLGFWSITLARRQKSGTFLFSLW